MGDWEEEREEVSSELYEVVASLIAVCKPVDNGA